MEEGQGLSAVAFPVLGEAAATVQPSEGPLDDPAFGQNGETLRRGYLGLIGSLDDLDVDPAADPSQAGLEAWSLVSAVGVELEQERIEAEQGGHHPDTAVAVLHVGPVHQGVHQQTLGVDEDVALLAFDLLARIVAGRIDRRPPFSAPLTLWLSMIAAVGLASRPAFSRHATNSA